MNKKMNPFFSFIFCFTICKAIIAFLVIIPYIACKEVGWIGIMVNVGCFILAIVHLQEENEKKKGREHENL